MFLKIQAVPLTIIKQGAAEIINKIQHPQGVPALAEALKRLVNYFELQNPKEVEQRDFKKYKKDSLENAAKKLAVLIEKYNPKDYEGYDEITSIAVDIVKVCEILPYNFRYIPLSYGINENQAEEVWSEVINQFNKLKNANVQGKDGGNIVYEVFDKKLTDKIREREIEIKDRRNEDKKLKAFIISNMPKIKVENIVIKRLDGETNVKIYFNGSISTIDIPDFKASIKMIQSNSTIDFIDVNKK